MGLGFRSSIGTNAWFLFSQGVFVWGTTLGTLKHMECFSFFSNFGKTSTSTINGTFDRNKSDARHVALSGGILAGKCPMVHFQTITMKPSACVGGAKPSYSVAKPQVCGKKQHVVDSDTR